MECYNKNRQCFIRWSNNTNTYDEDPLCEAKRIWGPVFLNVYDFFYKLCTYVSPPPKIKTD